MRVHKINLIKLFCMPLLLVSTLTTANLKVAEIISEEVKQQMIVDISISDARLATDYKEEFGEYYRDEIFPRIDNLENHILSSAVNQIAPDVYALWTEGISPSAWGGNEFLYIISMEIGSPIILASLLLDPQPSRTNEGYRISDFWIKPNTGCGYNDFVGGVLQYGDIGGSGSTFVQIYAEYSRYDNSYSLRKTTSPLRFSKPNCTE